MDKDPLNLSSALARASARFASFQIVLASMPCWTSAPPARPPRTVPRTRPTSLRDRRAPRSRPASGVALGPVRPEPDRVVVALLLALVALGVLFLEWAVLRS